MSFIDIIKSPDGRLPQAARMPIARSGTSPLRAMQGPITAPPRPACRLLTLLALAPLATTALACPDDTSALFSCQASGGRKFIELCASLPASSTGTLQYRFGSLDAEGREKAVELVYPRSSAGSMKQFFGATYTHQGLYTQSIRFVSGGYSYTVFTEARGARDEGAGVVVRHLSTGQATTVSCSERPRFYIFELTGKLPCDTETAVGTACIR